MATYHELVIQLENLNLQIEAIEAAARVQVVREIREKMAEHGITLIALERAVSKRRGRLPAVSA